MINIDFLTIKAFFYENKDFIIGARVQKIQQPTRKDFIFFLRNGSESRKLYINIKPQYYHMAFMSKENEEKRNIVIPKKPPMFCMLLRKYLEGAKISDAQVVKNERIFELYFDIYDELSQQRSLCLTFELMGKHSNVILYDKDTEIIIGCAHNVGSEKSRYRELQGGLSYIYPPHREELSNELIKQFCGLSEEEKHKYLNADEFHPALKGERYTLFAELIKDSVRQKSVNEMIDNYYSDFQQKIILNNEKAHLSELADANLKKIKNSISKIVLLLNKRDNTEKYKLYGELITANLYKKEFDYKKYIEVFDYNSDENIKIALDETKSLNENAQRYFKLYAKSKTTKEKSEEQIKKLTMEKDYYENVLYGITCAKSISDLEEVKSELSVAQTITKKQTTAEKISVSGFDVYVGKNNKQNDYIVSKLAKDEDYWFHTHNCAGSHVLLKVNGIEPPEEVIYACCKLAREYSSAKQPSKVGVIYTKAKNLRKPPASPLGYVTYKNEKEVLI